VEQDLLDRSMIGRVCSVGGISSEFDASKGREAPRLVADPKKVLVVIECMCSDTGRIRVTMVLEACLLNLLDTRGSAQCFRELASNIELLATCSHVAGHRLLCA
jgi:hypothetical protein